MQLNNVFMDWLHKRKISDKIIEEFNLSTLGDKLVIPVLGDDGFFLFNKYRRSPFDDHSPKYTYDKGGKLALYGGPKSKPYDFVLWVEGEMDALVVWSHNIPAVSSTGGALSINQEWISYFKKNTIICFDNDPAGGEGMVKALAVAPQAKVLFIPDKAGVKDISDYVAHGGDLNELIKTARLFNDLEEIIADKAERESQWQSTYFHDAYIKAHTKPIKKPYVRDPSTTDRITRAKQYPIHELLKLNQNKARCLWHAEKESSLHYYPEQNKLWCFGGCGRGYDSIDVYKKINNCSFIEAIDKLQ